MERKTAQLVDIPNNKVVAPIGQDLAEEMLACRGEPASKFQIRQHWYQSLGRTLPGLKQESN